MQRPNRPGRYFDPWEDYVRPVTPTVSDRPMDARIPRNARFDIRRSRRTRSRSREPSWVMGLNFGVPLYTPLDDSIHHHFDQQPPPRPAPPLPRLAPPLPVLPEATTNRDAPAPSPRNISDLNDLVTYLLGILECPVCLEYVSTPILQCREGHLVCSSCRVRLHVCPKCRQPFADIRSRSLEQIAEVLPYPCHNDGCDIQLQQSERRNHEAICPHRMYPCTLDKCTWLGARFALPDHLAHAHPNSLITSHHHEIPFAVNSNGSLEKAFIMQCYNEMFNCVLSTDPTQMSFVGYVKHLGAREKTDQFEFELKFVSLTSPHSGLFIKKPTLPECLGSPTGSAVVVSYTTLREVFYGDVRPFLGEIHVTITKREAAAGPSGVTSVVSDSPASPDDDDDEGQDYNE